MGHLQSECQFLWKIVLPAQPGGHFICLFRGHLTCALTSSLVLSQGIPHQSVAVGVKSSYLGTFSPIAGVKTYLFTSAGAYMGKSLTSDASGITVYELPERAYKVRADYLGYQWLSSPFTWTASNIVIPEGEATISVSDSGSPVSGVNVYVFTSAGAYMGLYGPTNASGEASFLLPAQGGNSTNYNGYKFRADFAGVQYWSSPLLLTPSMENPVAIPVGGGAGIFKEPSVFCQGEKSFAITHARSTQTREPVPTGTEIQVASLLMLPGILAGLANSAIADSNGEHLYFYHSDHLGTPLFLTDVSGTVVWKGEYFPFGEVFAEDKDPDGDGVQVEQPFRFPGQYEDEETGLYHNYFRDYEPRIGRYVEGDPKGQRGGINLFTYVNNNAVSLMDPFGLEELSCKDCPGGEWEGSSFFGLGLFYGGGITIDTIFWNCLSSGATCEATYFCFGGGLKAEASLSLVGTAKATGAYKSIDLIGWSSGIRVATPFFTVAHSYDRYGDAETTQVSGGVGIGAGVAYISCTTIVSTCEW